MLIQDHMEVKKKKGKAKQNMSLEQVPKGATPGGRVEGVDDPSAVGRACCRWSGLH